LRPLLTSRSTIDLIVKAVKPVLERHAIEVEVKSEAEQKWVNDVQTALKSRVYADNCATVGFLISSTAVCH
jgi:hypothetical protein